MLLEHSIGNELAREAFAPLRRSTRLVLEFDINNHGIPPQSSALRALRTDLRDHFFTHVYVHQPVEDDLVHSLGLGGLVVLRGVRGAGKSTTLSYLVSQCRGPDGPFRGIEDVDIETVVPRYHEDYEPEGLVLFRLNLEQLDIELSDTDAKRVVLDAIWATLRLGLDTNRDAWYDYLSRSDAFAEFRELAFRHGDDPATLRELRTSEFQEQFETCLTQLVSHDAPLETRRERTLLALRFLALHGYFCIIAVDNIDHQWARIAERLCGTLADISRALNQKVTIFVPIRDEHVDSLRARKWGTMRVVDHWLHAAGSEPRRETVVVDNIKSILRTRLTVLDNHWTDIVAECDDSKVARLATELGSSPSDLIADYQAFLHELVEQALSYPPAAESPQRAASMMLQWHNENVRFVGGFLARLIGDVLCNVDPDAPYSELRNALIDTRPGDNRSTEYTDWIIKNNNYFRMMLCRLFYFSFRSSSAEPPPFCYPFTSENDYDEQSETLTPIRVLRLLRHHNGGVHRDSACRDLAQFGVAADDAVEWIARMSQPRDEDDTGMIEAWIDRSGKVGVKLNPAGMVMADELLRSPDYFFWAVQEDEDVAVSCFKKACEVLEIDASFPLPYEEWTRLEFRMIAGLEVMRVLVLAPLVALAKDEKLLSSDPALDILRYLHGHVGSRRHFKNFPEASLMKIGPRADAYLEQFVYDILAVPFVAAPL